MMVGEPVSRLELLPGIGLIGLVVAADVPSDDPMADDSVTTATAEDSPIDKEAMELGVAAVLCVGASDAGMAVGACCFFLIISL